MSARTPGPQATLMTGEEGEVWQCRVWNSTGRVTNWWPTKGAAEAEAARQRILMNGTSCVQRIGSLRIGSAA